MKTELVLFTLIALMLIPALLVQGSAKTSYTRFSIIAITTFLAVQIGLNSLTDSFDLHRSSSMERVLQSLLRSDTSQPTLFIAGSSYTSRVLNGDSLENMLHANGTSVDVKQLSYPGSYAHENDFYIDRYLSNSSTHPKIALIEIGTEGITELKPQNRMASNVIRFHDTRRVGWMLQIIWFDSAEMNLIKRLSLTRDVLKHYLANLLHIGLLLQIEPSWDLPPQSGFYPDDQISATFDSVLADSVIRKLREGTSDVAVNRTSLSVIARYRLAQKERLLSHGVTRVLFYQTPMLHDDRRLAISALCAELGDDCIATDAELWKRLDVTMWTDMGHLGTRGSDAFASWLASRVAVKMESEHAL